MTGSDAGKRLESLRRRLAAERLDGYIQPRADEYQGEFVAAWAERLAWLTGFTGSAGLAVVLADKAALFTDGRYALQAAREVDGSLFEIIKTSGAASAGWITANLAEGGKLAYDPRLVTVTQAKKYQTACNEAGGELAAIDVNPVDALWNQPGEDRPDPPLAPIRPYDVAFAGETSDAKREKIAKDLQAAGGAAAVLTAPDSIAWLLNVRGADVPFSPLPLCFAIIYADGTMDLFAAAEKTSAELEEHLGGGVRIKAPDAFGPALDELGAGDKPVHLDSGSAADWVQRRLAAAGAEVRHRNDPCQLPKACKNGVELAGMRQAHLRDGVALTRFLAWLAEEGSNADEISAAEKLEALRRENGPYRGPSFATISAAGANAAIVHYQASGKTNRKLEPGSLYLVDSGGQYPDGTTDATRTVLIGAIGAAKGKSADEMRDRFSRVLKGHIAVAAAVFPEGTTGGELDPLARQALWRAGLDYDHGTGHGVGCYLGVHEGPQRISKTAGGVALKPGMILSNEPGYYKKDAYGIRIENLMAVTAAPAPSGAERDLLAFDVLTMAPIDRALIDLGLMTDDEISWLDAYHKRVRDAIAPLVGKSTGRWLEAATEPLV